jgi:hypothetical protein
VAHSLRTMTETFCGLPKKIAAVGAVAGAGLAGVWLLSPIGVCVGVAMAFIFAGALRGLAPRERRWVAGLLGTALVLRLLALLAFSLFVDYNRDQFPMLFGDEILFKKVPLLLRNVYFDIPISTDHFRESTWEQGGFGLHVALACLQVLFGPAPYGAHFLNVAFFFGGSVLLYRTVRVSYGRLPALGSLAVVLFLPTLFMWSISALKEPPHVLMLSVIVVAALQTVRAGTWVRRIAALSLVVGAIAFVGTLRVGAQAMGIATVLGAYAATVVTAKRWMCILAIALSFVVVVAGWQSSRVQTQVLSLTQEAAGMHLGHVNTSGYVYKMLDQRFYGKGNGVPIMTMVEAMRFAVRAAVSFVVVPAPWQTFSRSGLAYLPQQMVWYLLFILAVVGCVVGFQKDALLTFLLLATFIVYGIIIALTSGNIGTMVRHRDLIVPIVVWFSGLGAASILSWTAVRTRRRCADSLPRLDTLSADPGL